MAERLLVVDDDRSFCDVVQFRLAAMGFHVFCAATPEQGVQSGLFCQPQVVLLDCHLSSARSGIALIRWFQSVVPLAPIVMMSADESLGLAADVLHRGAFVLWRKADGPTTLAMVVDWAIREHRLRVAGARSVRSDGEGRRLAQAPRSSPMHWSMGERERSAGPRYGVFDPPRAARTRA